MSSVLLFQGSPGAAVRLVVSPGGTAGTISIPSVVGNIKHGSDDNTFTGGFSKLFQNYSAIITGLDIEEAANANAMYAADGRIYMHVPGDKLGSLTVSGVTFAAACGESGSSESSSKTPGLVKMLQWYRDHRVSNPKFSDPITVTLNGNESKGPLEGYLASFSSRVVDIAHQIYSFTLPMYLVPGEVS
jgi:hypothetical protein